MDQWDVLIEELEESLEYVQCALETGNWDDDPPKPSPRPVDLPTPTPTQRSKVISLVEEVASTEQALQAQMDETMTELGQSPKKLQAARRYSGSVALARS